MTRMFVLLPPRGCTLAEQQVDLLFKGFNSADHRYPAIGWSFDWRRPTFAIPRRQEYWTSQPQIYTGSLVMFQIVFSGIVLWPIALLAADFQNQGYVPRCGVAETLNWPTSAAPCVKFATR